MSVRKTTEKGGIKKVAGVQRAPLFMQYHMRYQNNEFLQKWWLGSLREDLSNRIKHIEFFEKFAMRHFHNRELSERSNDILNELKHRKRHLETCLQIGDSPDEESHPSN